MNNSNKLNKSTRANKQPKLRTSALASAVYFGLLMQGQAFAQEASSSTNDESVMDTVTVTAQGREENIIDVPYNISVVSGELIEQAVILDSVELLRYVPGISTLDRGVRGSDVVSGVRIRGVNVDSSALGDYAVGAAPTVAAYVDNTPIYANFLLSDIERVEVLRGPQGTLYGSGALSGAVRYIMRKPDLESRSGRISGSFSDSEYSSGSNYSGSLTYNQPLSSTFAVRINGTINDFAGVTDYRNLYALDNNGIPVAPDGVLSDTAEYYSKKDADSFKQNYGRISMLWQPSDKMDFTLSYMAQSDDAGGRRASTPGNDGYGAPYKDFEVGSIQLEPSERDVYLTSLEANFDLGFATLTSSTAYYNNEGNITSENTGFYAQNGWLGAFYYNYPRPMATAVRSFGDEAFTQELRLVSNEGEEFDYIVGAFYIDQNRLSTQDSYLVGLSQWAQAAGLPWITTDQDYHYRQEVHFTEIAVYGQLTWHATSTLDFTGGLRFFDDNTTTNGEQAIPIWSIGPDYSEGKESDSKVLFMANMSWQFTNNNQMYLTISEGYRRGGTNGVPTIGFFAEDTAWSTYEPDTVTNYEIGVKGMVGRMNYNADIFYMNWDNPQINSATTNWGFYAVQNIPSASTQGIELELSQFFDNGFGYGLGYTYTDAELDQDAISADGVYVINYKGATLAGVPENIFNAWFNYGVPVGQGLLTFRGDYYYQSETLNVLNQSTSRQYYELDGFNIINLSATYSLNAWDMTLWLKNATNEQGSTGIFTIPYMGTDPSQNYYGSGAKFTNAVPRTLGLTVSYSF